jgi:hypothetical protein
MHVLSKMRLCIQGDLRLRSNRIKCCAHGDKKLKLTISNWDLSEEFERQSILITV